MEKKKENSIFAKKSLGFEKLLGKWIVPITKDFDNKSELRNFSPFNCEVRMAKLNTKKWILVRQLTEEDVKSMDFQKYLTTFNYKTIERTEKLNG